MNENDFLKDYLNVMGFRSWQYLIASIIIVAVFLVVLGIGELVDHLIFPT